MRYWEFFASCICKDFFLNDKTLVLAKSQNSRRAVLVGGSGGSASFLEDSWATPVRNIPRAQSCLGERRSVIATVWRQLEGLCPFSASPHPLTWESPGDRGVGAEPGAQYPAEPWLGSPGHPSLPPCCPQPTFGREPDSIEPLGDLRAHGPPAVPPCHPHGAPLCRSQC